MQIKIAVCLPLIFLVTNAHGDLGVKVQNLNKVIKSIGQDDDCGTCKGAVYYPDPPGPQSNMQKCVESLCPDSSFSLSAVQIKTYVKAAQDDPTYKTEIQPIINSIAKESAKESLARSKSAMAYLSNPPPFSDPNAVRLFNLLYGLQSLDNFKFTSEDNGNTVIDEKKSRAEAGGLSDADFKFKVAIGNRFLAKYIESRPFSSVDPATLQLTYTPEGLDARIKVSISEIERKRDLLMQNPDFKFITSVPSIMDSMSNKNLEAPFADGKVDSEGLSNLNRTSAILDIFLESSSNSQFREFLQSRAVDVKKYVQENSLEAIYKDRIQKQEQALNSSGDLLSSKCRYAFEFARQVLPSQADLESFGSRVGPMKDIFLQKTKGLVCSSEQGKYNDDVGNWDAKYPQTREQFLQGLKRNLQRQLDNQMKWRTEFDAIEKSPNKDSIYIISLSSLRADYTSPTYNTDELCDDLTPSMTPDATKYNVNGFIVGPVVISNQAAKGVTFHELGHKLWAFFNNSSCNESKNLFKNARGCLLQNHSELSDEEMQKQKALRASDKITKYEEEDWADLISVKTYSQNNFACLFARSMKSADYKNLSLQNPDDSDVHSSDLFRLLHINFLTSGKIPEICDQALAERGEKANFKDCLQEESSQNGSSGDPHPLGAVR